MSLATLRDLSGKSWFHRKDREDYANLAKKESNPVRITLSSEIVDNQRRKVWAGLPQLPAAASITMT